MGKNEAGRSVGRYSIPLDTKELDFFKTLLSKAFDSCGLDYVIQVKDDSHKKTEKEDSWTYGIFANKKYFVCSFANMTEYTRDYKKTLFSPVNSMIFVLTKERGVSSYEKLQKLDSSLQHYPAVAPYCDIDYFTVDTTTDGRFRTYRGKTKYKYEGGNKCYGHMYAMYNTDLNDYDFISSVVSIVFDTARNKAHYPVHTVESFTHWFMETYGDMLEVKND